MATQSSPETPEQPIAPSSVPFPVEHTDSDLDSDPDISHTHSTPNSACLDTPLLPDGQPRTPRSHTVNPNFVSSPLNPNAPIHSSYPPSSFMGSRAHSRRSMVFNRVPSEESQALASQRSSLASNRASMILYRLAGEDEQGVLLPPVLNRQSVHSSSADSVFSLSYDSKYPFGAHTPQKLIPYPFDPSLDMNTPEDDDAIHDPSDNTLLDTSSGITLRGFANVGVLLLVLLALLFLFIFYPVWHYTIKSNSTVS